MTDAVASPSVASDAGLVRGIAERKDSDLALRASEERFRLLVQSIKDYAIFMLDSEGCVATWNAGAQACKGYTPAEILGQHFSVFYTADDRDAGKPKYLLDIAKEETRVEDYGWRVRQDGSEFWANVLITAIRDETGTLVGFAKVTRDLTERRNAEDIAERKRLEELQARRNSQELEEENRRMHEANRLKSEFLANMSHELRTPLNAIIGFADLMFREKVGPISLNHQEYLGDILKSSHHLLQLVNDVLDLAKVESGKMEFHPEPVDLAKVIAEVRNILGGLASTKRIRVETSVPTSLNAAVLDPSKLKQVLYNYLSNALKFTPEGGQVTINVLPEEGGRVRIEVEDTGIGIRREDTRRLFVEFQQLDAGMSKKYPGTGLGLALTRRIVEAQGGSVGVSSEPGRGSTFWAVLPRNGSSVQSASATQAFTPPASRQALPSPSAASTPEEPVVPVHGAEILIVDDNPANLKLARLMLEVEGYTVRTATDAEDALQTLATFTPRVILMDIQLPGMDGLELTRRLKADAATKDILIFALTAYAMKGDEEKALAVGCDGYVTKPIDIESLARTLASHLAKPSETA